MKRLEAIKSVFNTSKKSFDGFDDGFVPLSTYSQFDLQKLSRSNYMQYFTSWVFACVKIKSDGLAMLDFNLKNGTKTIDHKYLNFVKMPLLRDISACLDIYGNAYVWMNKVGNNILGLEVLNPVNVRHVKDTRGKIVAYDYTYNGHQYRYQKDEVIDFHNFDPNLMFPYTANGIGNMDAVGSTILLDGEANKRNQRFFKNSGRPDGVLQTSDRLTQADLEKLQDQRHQKYGGAENSHKVPVLTSGLEYKQIAISQKDMDFIEQRRFDRDEILAIFNVPKALIGMGEAVNVGNVKAFETIFARWTIKPLATLIAERLNETLFKNVGIFEFINVVPVDQEEVRANFQAGGLTVNEFRISIGQQPIVGGDMLKPDPFTIIQAEPLQDNKSDNNSELDFKIKSIFHRAVNKVLDKDSEEYKEDQRHQKIIRNNNYENNYKKKLLVVFEEQKKDILTQFEKIYDKKALKSETPILSIAKYLSLYYSLLKEEQDGLVIAESKIAYSMIGLNSELNISKKPIKEWMKNNILKFARSIDETTNGLLSDKMSYIVDNGLSVYEGKKLIEGVFTDLSTSRVDQIVRTETIRAGNFATIQSREESNVVEGKQRYTALDERVCGYCDSMNGKIIGLKENFFDKGGRLTVGNSTLKLDYDDVDGAPLHTNCRCTLIPVLK